LWGCIQKIVTKTSIEESFPCFCSRSFIDLGLIFESLLHFELIFMYSVKKYIFTLWHVDIQLSQHHLLKKTIFSPLCIIDAYVEDWLIIFVWNGVWALYSVPFIYISVLCQYYSWDYCKFV
jgi:hypothetical protein